MALLRQLYEFISVVEVVLFFPVAVVKNLKLLVTNIESGYEH